MPRHTGKWLVVLGTVLAAGPGGAAPAGTPVVVALGDSITLGAGVNPHEAYPAVVQVALRRERTVVNMVNQGVGGSAPTRAWPGWTRRSWR